MYAAVSVIRYIAENNASWEKESGSVAKLWASNIRFGYCAIMTDDVIHSANDGYTINKHATPSTSCTGVWLAITMLQYYICLGIVLTVILVLGLGLGFGIILYFVIGT